MANWFMIRLQEELQNGRLEVFYNRPEVIMWVRSILAVHILYSNLKVYLLTWQLQCR